MPIHWTKRVQRLYENLKSFSSSSQYVIKGLKTFPWQIAKKELCRECKLNLLAPGNVERNASPDQTTGRGEIRRGILSPTRGVSDKIPLPF
jgi:hypothetical protein